MKYVIYQITDVIDMTKEENKKEKNAFIGMSKLI